MIRPGLACLLATFLAVAAQAQEWVVAIDGDDAGAGDGLHPLRTAEAAHRRLTAAVAGDRRSTQVLRFRSGTHILERTLVITPDQVPEAGLTITGDPEAVLSGGVPTSWEADGPDRWRLRGGAPLPLRSTGMSHGLVPLPPTRWPGEGLGAQVADVEGPFLRLDPPAPPGWGELVLCHDWGTCRAWVPGLGGRIPRAPGLTWPGYEDLSPSRGRKLQIEGVAMPAIAAGARWYTDLDRLFLAAKTPPPGTIWLHRLEEVLVLAGRPDAPLVGVAVNGLTVAHAAWLRPIGGLAGVQAGHVATGGREGPLGALPGAIRLEWVRGATLVRLQVAASDGSGVVVGAGCRDVVIERCRIEDSGGCGIMVGWRGGADAIAALSAPWEAGTAPVNTQVRRCRVARCARLDWGSVGVADVLAEGTCIERNLIEDLPYSGISLGFRWDTSVTTQRQTLVAGNRIRHVTRRLADGGGIYTLGWQPGTVVRDNLIEHVERHPWAQGAPNAGLFFDNGSKGLLVEGNVISDIAGEAMRWNGCAPSWIILGANQVVPDGASAPLPPMVAEGVGP